MVIKTCKPFYYLVQFFFGPAFLFNLGYIVRIYRGKCHFCYFLIVWDICRWCREQGTLVQGRGSAANSAVCYALGITAVDPVKMELLFERFLSEERGEWPDIDLDLPSGDRREAVEIAGDLIMGAEYASTHTGLGRLAKIYDFGARIPFHIQREGGRPMALAGLWEFPGVEILEGESVQAGAVRAASRRPRPRSRARRRAAARDPRVGAVSRSTLARGQAAATKPVRASPARIAPLSVWLLAARPK